MDFSSLPAFTIFSRTKNHSRQWRDLLLFKLALKYIISIQNLILWPLYLCTSQKLMVLEWYAKGVHWNEAEPWKTAAVMVLGAHSQAPCTCSWRANRHFLTHIQAYYCHDTYRKLKSFRQNINKTNKQACFIVSSECSYPSLQDYLSLKEKHLKPPLYLGRTLFPASDALSSHFSVVGSAFSRALLLQTARS